MEMSKPVSPVACPPDGYFATGALRDVEQPRGIPAENGAKVVVS
jgi:hypothetical protein